MKKSILFIDDDEEDHFLFREALLEIKCDVTVHGAIDGPYALGLLEQLKDNLPALIILDMNLPKMDGFEVMEQIKKNYTIPILMHTTSCTFDIIQRAKAMGALDCSEKARSYSELLSFGRDVMNRLK